MPILDTVPMNVLLAATFGPDRAAIAPDEWEVALWCGDPADDSSFEQTGGGYARVTVDSDDFPAYASLTDGSTFVLVEFAAASAEWVDETTHWVLIDPAGNIGPYGELSEPLDVTGAGTFDPVAVTLFFDDPTEEPS